MVTKYPMNSFKGNIRHILTKGNISIVTIDLGNDIHIKTIVIETPETNECLKLNHAITILFKETETNIGRLSENDKISTVNAIDGTLLRIEKGTLLSNVILQTPIGVITSTIFSETINTLPLNIGDKVTAFINPHEIMLSY